MAKLLLWIVIGFLVAGVAAWMMTIEQGYNNPVVVLLFVVVFAVPPVGGFWMLYLSIRYEKRPLPMILIAFVPYAFLWYYFERVRTRKYLSEGRNPGGSPDTSGA